MYIHIDHFVICYLMNNLVLNGRIIRWLLLLKEFDITIIDKYRKENVVSNFLSRLTTKTDDFLVDDAFSNEHIFVVIV